MGPVRHPRTPAARTASPWFGHRPALALGALIVFGATGASAQTPTPPWQPSAAFIQAGAASHTTQLTVGAAWDAGESWSFGPGRLGVYVEASASAWSYPRADGGGRTDLLEIGLTPVLRYRLAHGESPWFIEAGIGATLTSRLYRTPSREFSTRFNFGDHLGVGLDFGPHREHEVALRFEHFSNAGISEPNPGENFVQLRYTLRFR
ncbi:MAG TPA: acyloxyacyl hydrolase [Burkholderiaceae bacterium]|nr:acyloxyacyl hydrolase [Burkholderiaceae bacterium]